MMSFGFDASILTRSALGVGFIAAAVVMVWIIERPSPTDAQPVAQTPAQPVPSALATRSWPVTIESTYAVARWSVRILNVDQVATHQDGYSWSGMIPAAVGDEMLVQAQAADSDHAPNHGLRLLIGSAPERLVWGGGDVTTTVEISK